MIVWERMLEPFARTRKVPDTELAALKEIVPGCAAMMVQLPVLLRITVAWETLLTID